MTGCLWEFETKTMAQIHSSAIVEPGAELARDVVVGPFCHVGSRAKIGPGTRLISHVAVHGDTTLGASNNVWPFAVLGADPQDLKYAGEESKLVIGDHNDIRESVTIHKGTAADAGVTCVGDHNLIMAYAHIGHDCVLGNHIIITNAVQLAGHIIIEDHAAVGGATAVHHFVTIGQYAYVGGMTRVVHDVPPFMFVEGNPSRVRGINTIGLKRHGFAEETEEHLKDAWRRLFKKTNQPNGVGDSTQGLASLEAEYADDWAVKALVEALRRSAAGVFGRYRETLRRDHRYSNPVR